MVQQLESAINDNAKHSVNLFNKSLLPKKPLISLTRVIISWLVVLILMLAWAAYLTQQLNSFTVEQNKLTNKRNELTQLTSALEDKIKKHNIDPALEEKLSTLKLLMNNKQGLYARLTNAKDLNSTGFSQAMSELAKYHHKGISLQEVRILPDGITLSGIAKNPDVVPLWLNGFENSSVFSGQKFSQFSLSENENKHTHFILSAEIQANIE